MTFRRLDGREIPPDEFPTARAIRTGETVRAEELVIHLPDGRAITTVINATPVRSAEGEVVSVIATIKLIEERLGWYCLPSNIALKSSQPQFEDGFVYRQKRPTTVYGRYHDLRDVAGQLVNAPRSLDSCIVMRWSGGT